MFSLLRRYKPATLTNLAGFALSFLLFILIGLHVNYEYGFDSSISNRERIFQLENLRDDGIWESNFSRPQLERFLASSPSIEATAITNNMAYSSYRLGVSTRADADAVSYMETLERITPGYTDVFGFELCAGSTDCLKRPDGLLLSEKTAKRFFGEENPIGKPLYFTEFRGLDGGFSLFGIEFNAVGIVGGVYRDFPENTRVKNALYAPILEKEMMHDWYTGPYYAYFRTYAPEATPEEVSRYVKENKEFLHGFGIEDIRARPLPQLYFGSQVRADATPSGSKLRTNILLFMAFLIIGIAFVNYVNLSVALAPVRIKSITMQKILGCSQRTLRWCLIAESTAISFFAFLVALLFLLLLKDSPWVVGILGHSPDLSAGLPVFLFTCFLALTAGVVAGIYPAYYTVSFPPVTALNGSFSLTDRAKITRKLLVGSQFVVSITLIAGSLFVFLQNRYLEKVNLGYERENILEVRQSIGSALSKNELFRDRLLEHPRISDVAFSTVKFVSDESRTSIGYNYKNQHHYMSWLGVSSGFPQLMGISMLAGRTLTVADEAGDNPFAVCIINETAARELAAGLPPGDISDLSELVGTSIHDNDTPVQIVGIFRDVHHESLYKDVRPLGLWVSAKGKYRRTLMEAFSYVKINGEDSPETIAYVREITNELNPGYPADIRFFDQSLEDLYDKSHRQGLLVAALCLLAVVLSLAGVFGLVIFESQGREKEIAIRKVFGASIRQILWLFNVTFLRVLGVGFLLSIPLAYYGASEWLQGFAYKTPLYPWVFVLAFAVSALLTILTVTLQSYRVATSNPALKL